MNNIAQKILLLSSDTTIALQLRELCLELSIDTLTINMSADSIRRACDDHWDLAIIYSGHDHNSALDACRKIKSGYPLGQVLVVSDNTDQEYVVSCIKEGADDYVISPWNAEILKARISVATNRHQLICRLTKKDTQTIGIENQRTVPTTESTDSSKDNNSNYRHIGDVRLCPYKREVTIDDNLIHLTRTEYLLLTYLAEHIGRPCSSVELLKNVLGYEDENYLPSLHSHVSRLRRKLRQSTVTSIETIWCYGYRFLTN
jgi:DNA-binding response OmpR family regulator